MRQEIKSLVEQLQKDDSLDRQYEVVKKHGILGLEAIFQSQSNKFFDLPSVPPDCPWFDCRGMAPAEAIAHIFKPVAAELPIFITTLQEKCQHIFVLQSEKRWQIGYFSDRKLEDGQKFFSLLLGEAPNENPTVSAALKKANWVLPEPLRLMYSVHEGISEVSISSETLLLPAADLIVMDQLLSPEALQAGADLDYSYNDLLMFYLDGTGNGQCFYRQENKNTALETVDWDHETRELSPPEPFFRFLDENLWRLLIDEESYEEYPLGGMFFIDKMQKLYDADAYHKILQMYDELENFKFNSIIVSLKVEALFDLERYQECVDFIDSLPNDAFNDKAYAVDIWRTYAYSNLELLDWEKAAKGFANSLDLDHDSNVNAGNNAQWLGYILHVHLNKPKDAMPWLKQALKLYARDIESITEKSEKAECFYAMATVHALLENTDEAFINLKEAVRLNKAYKKQAPAELEFASLLKDKSFKEIIS